MEARPRSACGAGWNEFRAGLDCGALFSRDLAYPVEHALDDTKLDTREWIGDSGL